MTSRRSIMNAAAWGQVAVTGFVEGTLPGASGISAFIGQSDDESPANGQVHLVVRAWVKNLPDANVYQWIADLATYAPDASGASTSSPGPKRFRIRYLNSGGGTVMVTSHAIGSMSAQYGGVGSYTMRHGDLPGHAASDPSLPDEFFELDMLFDTYRDATIPEVRLDELFHSSNTLYALASGSKWGAVHNITHFQEIGVGEANYDDFWKGWPEPFEGQTRPL